MAANPDETVINSSWSNKPTQSTNKIHDFARYVDKLKQTMRKHNNKTKEKWNKYTNNAEKICFFKCYIAETKQHIPVTNARFQHIFCQIKAKGKETQQRNSKNARFRDKSLQIKANKEETQQ